MAALVNYLRMLRSSRLSWPEILSVLTRKAISFLSYEFVRQRDRLLPNNHRSCLELQPDMYIGDDPFKAIVKWRQHLAGSASFLDLATPQHAVQNLPLQRAKQILEGDFGLYGSYTVGRLRMLSGREALSSMEHRSHSSVNSLYYDPLNDYAWPSEKWFRDVLHGVPAGVDVKLIWELSRFHHLTTLGLCYRETRDPVYTHTFREQLCNWIRSNPYPYGPNWASTLEVAIRCANWLVGLMCFHDASELDEDFWSMMLASLACHGNHIVQNLEKLGSFTSNHYAGNIAGLFFLAALSPVLKQSSRWLEFATGELEREIINQTHPDGWHFEGSSCYHRLVTEMFYYCEMLGRVVGVKSSDRHKQRLQKMIQVLAELQKPTKEIPQVGDNDSGRFLVLNIHQDKASLKVDYLVESLPGMRSAPASPQRCSRTFGDSGRFLFRSDRIYLLLLAGPKGQRGRGGHDHNDVLSFELNVNGQDVFVDPGTYTYTGSLEHRNYFRSVRSHNTLSWQDLEPCTFEPQQPFVLYEQGRLELHQVKMDPALDVFQATYYYHDRWHRREVLLHKDEDRVEVIDTCSHPGADLVFICAPAIVPTLRGNEVDLGPATLILCNEHCIEVDSGYYSPAYGAKVPTNRLSVRLSGREIRYEIRAN